MALAKIILDIMPKAQATKTKVNKWDQIKSERFWTEKKQQQNERKTHRQENKIAANLITDKGLLMSKRYKELLQ